MNPTPGSPLTEAQKRLVRESFESMQEYETSVVVLFYGRLFEIAPETRTLFKIDIREQSRSSWIPSGLLSIRLTISWNCRQLLRNWDESTSLTAFSPITMGNCG